MNIQHLLSQAPERLLAYWHSDNVELGRVGWRAEPSECPVAEWLDYEMRQTDRQIFHSPSVMADEIILSGQRVATPPFLVYFIDLVDSTEMAADAWIAGTDRVGREEALVALAEAERLAAQRLLPMRAEAEPCAYTTPHGAHCQSCGLTPVLYGFLSANPDPRERPEWLACWPFYGRLCERHQAHLVVPPSDWWPVSSVLRNRSAEAENELVICETV